MSTSDQLGRVVGQNVYDADGKKIGKASNLYASDTSRTPEWVTVRTGLFGKKDSFVPLSGARTDDSGLHVSARKNTVKDAPQVDGDGSIDDQEVTDLYRYYGIQPGKHERTQDGTGESDTSAPAAAGTTPGSGTAPAGESTPASGDSSRTGEGRTGSAETRDESIVRSEERLRAGTETTETGRVRLHKYVVTEEQQVTVPVQHEEVHVTREPVSPGDTPAGSTEIGDEEREVVLHEERPVVGKETVPVERVELDTETVQEEQQVSGTVRKEQVDVEDNTAGTDEHGRPRQA